MLQLQFGDQFVVSLSSPSAAQDSDQASSDPFHIVELQEDMHAVRILEVFWNAVDVFSEQNLHFRRVEFRLMYPGVRTGDRCIFSGSSFLYQMRFQTQQDSATGSAVCNIHFINPTGGSSPSTVQVATWWNSTEDFSIRATPCPPFEGLILIAQDTSKIHLCKI